MSNEKAAIFKHCSKLKGSNISISDDYSRDTISKRKSLWESARKCKQKGSKVKLVKDNLWIDSERFYWNEDKKTRPKVNTRQTVANCD